MFCRVDHDSLNALVPCEAWKCQGSAQGDVFFWGEIDSGEHPGTIMKWGKSKTLIFCHGLKTIYSLQNTCQAFKISHERQMGFRCPFANDPRFCGLSGEDWPRFFQWSETPVVLDNFGHISHSHPLQTSLHLWREPVGLAGFAGFIGRMKRFASILKGFTWTWQPIRACPRKIGHWVENSYSKLKRI